jgi:excisionase family DNA binding protein
MNQIRIDESPLLLGVPEAAALLGVGKQTMYRLVHAGRVPMVKIGRRYLIPRFALPGVVEDLIEAPAIDD